MLSPVERGGCFPSVCRRSGVCLARLSWAEGSAPRSELLVGPVRPLVDCSEPRLVLACVVLFDVSQVGEEHSLAVRRLLAACVRALRGKRGGWEIVEDGKVKSL